MSRLPQWAVSCHISQGWSCWRGVTLSPGIIVTLLLWEKLNILSCGSWSSAKPQSLMRNGTHQTPEISVGHWTIVNPDSPHWGSWELWSSIPAVSGVCFPLGRVVWFTPQLSSFREEKKKKPSLLERNYFNHWRGTSFIQVNLRVETITAHYWQIPSQPEMQQNKHWCPQPWRDDPSEQVVRILFLLRDQMPSTPNTQALLLDVASDLQEHLLNIRKCGDCCCVEHRRDRLCPQDWMAE